MRMIARMVDVSAAHQRLHFRLLDWFDALPDSVHGHDHSGTLTQIDADVILGADVVRRLFFAYETPKLRPKKTF